MAYTGGGVGGVYNQHMAPRAKMRQFRSPSFVLTSTVAITDTAFPQFVYHEGDVAIKSAYLMYLTTSSDKVTTFKLGTIADADAFATAQDTDAAATVGSQKQITLNNTSVRGGSNPLQHNGNPVLVAGTVLGPVFTGVANSGTVCLVINYWPLD